MKIEKRDILQDFDIQYHQYNKCFIGICTVNNGEFIIKTETKKHDTIEACISELKELLVKSYLKMDTKI